MRSKYKIDFSTSFEKDSRSLSCFLQNPDYDIINFLNSSINKIGLTFDYRVIQNVAIDIKYHGYIEKMKSHFNKIEKLENKILDYKKYLNNTNISNECKTRIENIRPSTVGQL